MLTTGNRCGHNPKSPRLSPLKPIRKGKGGLPRILSLAAERAKAWYRHPHKCRPLMGSTRRLRSERREACQIIIETVLSHLDLASLCLGTPTLDNGFIDVDMRILVNTSGMTRRRCERAILQLKKAGFMEVKQPRRINEHGDYVGLRAIRVVTSLFFEYLDLGPMLARERARSTEKLKRRARKANCTLTKLMRRVSYTLRNSSFKTYGSQKEIEELVQQWNTTWREYLRGGCNASEAQKRTNVDLGLPEGYSPGHEYLK